MKKILISIFLILCLVTALIPSCTENNTGTTVPETDQTSDEVKITTVTESVETEKPSAGAETGQTTPAEEKKVIFVDSLGRQVAVPKYITKVALSGPLTQIVLFALCPDKLVGLAAEWDESAEEFLDSKYYTLPLLGQLYGGKGTLNLETILASGAQVIIDVGEQKANMTEDMDKLQAQIQIPTVHIDAYTDGMGEAYRRLGELLNMEEEAEVIADYCEWVYANTLSIMERVGEDGKANLLYCSGENGINVIAKTSYHAELLDLLANNLAVVKSPSSKGTGNEVDLEQLMLWNPEVILFAPDSIYDTVGTNPDWATITAIKNKAYYEVPYGPYNWMGFPPSVQRYLGMMWLAQLLYPDIAQYDMYGEVSEYFSLFYHTDITREQYNGLVANSLGK